MAKVEDKFYKKFPYNYLGLDTEAKGNDQQLGDCPFCGKEQHFYINSETGLYECKVCNVSGNSYTFIRHFYDSLISEADSKFSKQKMQEIAQDRGLSVDVLELFGVVYYSENKEWIIPVRSVEKKIVNFRIYRPATAKTKAGGRALNGMPLALGGVETISQNTKTVWVCEGEWDAMALTEMLADAGTTDQSVVWLPGAGAFKEGWVEFFRDKKVILVFDKDKAGFIGRKRAGNILQESGIPEASISVVDWSSIFNAKDGYDLRDFYLEGHKLEELEKLVIPFPREEFISRTENINEVIEKFPHISERKISWQDVINEFGKYYKLSERLILGLKMMTANIYSLNIKDTTPNWQHIISPAGSAKTEWINSFRLCSHVHVMSNASAKSLVSGFATKKGNDPSLIPQIIGKALLIKDFTEILEMHRSERDEMMGVLRGAYDGYIIKQFGNGVVRKYEKCQFNIISACTKAIFGDNQAAMGERFLKFTMIDGNEYEDLEDVLIFSANQIGREGTITLATQTIMKEFCEHKFSYTEMPELSREDSVMLASLARLLAMMRVQVQLMEGHKEILQYRPQVEYGTRPMKVLSLVLRCLGMVNGPDMGYQITDIDRKIVVENAISSMTPFTFEIARAIYLAGEEGLTNNEISTICKLEGRPATRDYYRGLLEIVDVIYSYKGEPDNEKGAPPKYYVMTEECRKLWEKARIEDFGTKIKHKLDTLPRQKNTHKANRMSLPNLKKK